MNAVRPKCCVSLASVVLFLAFYAPSPAAGHPSDFGTLTVDVLITGDRIRGIDAAVVPVAGPSYEPFVPVERKRSIAIEILGALEIPADAATIQAEMSDRYHEVGFMVTFLSTTTKVERVYSKGFQEIARENGLSRLKLSVCAANDQEISDLDADRLGRPADPGRGERHGCVVWELSSTDPPVSFWLTTRNAIPRTGAITYPALAGIFALLAGVVLLRASRVHRRP